ncbi:MULTISPECIES: GNAT family N-acetyltransferase [Brevibacterium]|uniref:N-acetyltransferase GCN5 n=4 Tax=Bacteria TaxID=2 RepID=K9ALT8_9MICO|nr:MULTISPECIES: GNAT family N-acetyltransferase [Brevibacterium]NJE65428.1 N-acetyltransferase [Brevibacterium sp. LS14]SIG96878.1 acetyltransferase, ribosomal protein N-acetylase [Mycobacteroides abscessus subsp. abscessus]EKU47011.1 N-acetyltransferase GCN5 [Brevibacterium casei S18]KZE22784.1 acetyltransferase [Brevibacterium casei]MCM1014302.1 GNAT family N-acetyltransferase [Brevibacterium sp. XM4083]
MTVHVRSWSTDDAEALVDIYANADAELRSNIPDDRGISGAREWLDRVLAAKADGTGWALAIVEADGDLFGNVMASCIEQRHSTAWISYWLTASARGRGLASSALRTLVDVAHDELDVYRLELGYRVNNPASAAVARAAGFLVEGREREKLLYDGVRFDTEVCARLSGDPRSPGRRLPVRQ